MDGRQFDQITRQLAHQRTRRDIFRTIAGGAIAALGLTRTFGDVIADGEIIDCEAFCAREFPVGLQRENCISLGARQLGPCFDAVVTINADLPDCDPVPTGLVGIRSTDDDGVDSTDDDETDSTDEDGIGATDDDGIDISDDDIDTTDDDDIDSTDDDSIDTTDDDGVDSPELEVIVASLDCDPVDYSPAADDLVTSEDDDLDSNDDDDTDSPSNDFDTDD